MPSTITGSLDIAMEEHLARLEAFEPTALPVLSIYLNTQPDEHGRAPDAVPYLHREFKTIARTWAPGSPERHSFDKDVERIVAYASHRIDPATNGVAIFACWGAEEFFEAIQLTTPVGDNYISVGNQPHLYHLVRLDEHFPRYAAVLTDTNTARIFVFGLGQAAEQEDVKDRKMHRVKVGGWSQARYQRRVGNAHHEHAKEVIERLLQIVREEKIIHIVLAGGPNLLTRPSLGPASHRTLRAPVLRRPRYCDIAPLHPREKPPSLLWRGFARRNSDRERRWLCIEWYLPSRCNSGALL
jgi:hypothetical protein